MNNIINLVTICNLRCKSTQFCNIHITISAIFLSQGPSSEQYISAFRLLLAIKEGTLRGKLSDGERYKLFSLFDLLYANYVTRLLDKAPLLTKRDLEICCFLKFGLTNEELARIFQTSSDSVTKAKGRLKGRLGISSQEDLNAFLRDF